MEKTLGVTEIRDWKRNRERLFELISQAQESGGDYDPDEMMALVLEAQQAVRNEN